MNSKYELSDDQTLSERDRLYIIFILYFARVLKNEREKTSIDIHDIIAHTY